MVGKIISAGPGRLLITRRCKEALVIVFAFLLLGWSLSGCNGTEEPPASNANGSVEAEPPDPLPANLSNAIAEKVESDDGGAFSKFEHSSVYHSRLPCLVCHKRTSNAARISLPGKVEHSPCAGCHTLQFANKSSSICTICHTDTESGRVKSFPPLRSFGARFVHSKHLRTNCGTCHKPIRRGVAFSIPKRRNAHQTCFQCHTSRSGNRMASCSLCHKRGGGRIRRSTGSRAFAVSFSHAKHLSVQDLNCRTCHTVRGRSSRKQVTAPATAMHFAKKGVQSCASCHNNKRAFGDGDFANCRKCHQGNKFDF